MGSSCCVMTVWDRSPHIDVSAATQHHEARGGFNSNNSCRTSPTQDAEEDSDAMAPLADPDSTFMLPSSRHAISLTTIAVPNPLVSPHPPCAQDATGSDDPLVHLEAMPSSPHPCGRMASSGIRAPTTRSPNHIGSSSASASNRSAKKLSDGAGAAPLRLTAADDASRFTVRSYKDHCSPIASGDAVVAAARTVPLCTPIVPLCSQQSQQPPSLESASLLDAQRHHGASTRSANSSSITVVRDPPLFLPDRGDHSLKTATTLHSGDTATGFLMSESLRAELFGSRSFVAMMTTASGVDATARPDGGSLHHSV